MWYRCKKHGSYNVDNNTPHFHVHCPTCEREEENHKLTNPHSPEFDGTDEQWQKDLESLPSLRRKGEQKH